MEPGTETLARLSEDDHQQLQAILADAFSTTESLRRMVSTYLDENLALMIGDEAIRDAISGLLLTVVNMQREEDLVVAALATKPEHAGLRRFAVRWSTNVGHINQVLIGALKKRPSDPLLQETEDLLNRLRFYLTSRNADCARLIRQITAAQETHRVQLAAAQEAHRAELAGAEAAHRSQLVQAHTAQNSQLVAEQEAHQATIRQIEKLAQQYDMAQQAHWAELAKMRSGYTRQLAMAQQARQKEVLELQGMVQRGQLEAEGARLQADKLQVELLNWKSGALSLSLTVAALIISLCLITIYMAVTSGVALPWVNPSWDGFAPFVLWLVLLWALFYYTLHYYRKHFVH